MVSSIIGCLRILISLALIYRYVHFVDGGTGNRMSTAIRIVNTSLGSIEGRVSGNIVEFLGIPFAEPPVGKYRFRPSRPKRPWAPATIKAFNYSPECLQSYLYSSPQNGATHDENCLYLNIWTPKKRKITTLSNGTKVTESYSVMFWIYGGAFMHGSASKIEYIGNKLAKRDVILVSCNYRVGALGFLVSIPDGLFGNYGLHDQLLALQWVQDHIYAFGGDSSKVTIFGESAGSMSTALHMFDWHHFPRFSQPLFRSVILQSNPLGYKSITIANFIGSSFKELIDCEDLRCLQAESADEILHVQDTLIAFPRAIGDFFTWGPVLTDALYFREIGLRSPEVLDPSICSSQHCFVDDRGNMYPLSYASSRTKAYGDIPFWHTVSNITVLQPLPTLERLGKINIPIIMGTNRHEGNVFVFNAIKNRISKSIYQLLVIFFFREKSKTVLDMYAPLVRRIEKQQLNPDYRWVLAKIVGDYLFRCPNQYFAWLASQNGSKIFLYEFGLPSMIEMAPFCDGLSCHTAEIPFVFENLENLEAFERNLLQEHVTKSSRWYVQKSLLSRVKSIISGKYMIANSSHFSRKDGSLPYSVPKDTWYQWSYEVRKMKRLEVSQMMAAFWTNFAKFGNPNEVDKSKHHTKWNRMRSFITKHVKFPWVSGFTDSAFSAEFELPVWPSLSTMDSSFNLSNSNFSDLSCNVKSFGSNLPLMNPSSTSLTSQKVLIMIFNEFPSSFDVEMECICKKWNALQYVF